MISACLMSSAMCIRDGGTSPPGPGGNWGAEGRCARRPAQRRPASRPGLAGRPPAAPRGAGCVASPERIASLFRTISYSLLRRGSILYVGARALYAQSNQLNPQKAPVGRGAT